MLESDSLAAGGSVLAALSLAGCMSTDEGTFTEGFETGLDGWETAANIGSEKPLSAFEYELDICEEHAATDTHSLCVFTEGDHDDVPAGVGALFVSTGVSVIWEADATHFIGDVRVELTPR